MSNAPDNSLPAPTFSGSLDTALVDRDGVLNEKMPEGQYVTRWSEFKVLPGVVEAIGMLNATGVRVVVVSNQRGVALGLYAEEDVHEIHAEFQKLLETYGAHVDAFYVCPHDKGLCNCRKPLPGMFERAVADFPTIDAASSVMIGDGLVDIDFGRRLGMKTVFVEGDPERRQPGAEEGRDLADMSFPSFYAAVTGLLAKLSAYRQSSGTMCLEFPANPR
ncbi:MAG: HAD family hydrolase [Terracidiphilus sp.]